jgi:hypothetical protein
MKVNPYEQNPAVVGRLSAYLHVLYGKVSQQMPNELPPDDCPCLDCAFEMFANTVEQATGERPERVGESTIPHPQGETLAEYTERMREPEAAAISDEEAERLARMLEGIEGLTDD